MIVGSANGATLTLAAASWPTWQQAWLTSATLLVVHTTMRRLRPTVGIEAVRVAVHELIVLTGLYGLWRTARKLPLVEADGALERAKGIVDFQTSVGLPTELQIQQFVLDRDWLGWSSVAYYAGLHVPGLLAFLAWMFWRHPHEYGRWRNVLALTTAGCLVIRFWRVAPPRFLVDLGYQDLSDIHGMAVYGPIGTGVSGQFAAMPSIHVAWAGVVGLGIVAAGSSRWKWLFAAHLPITFFVVVATGHHWWLDGFVALGLVAVALSIDHGVRLAWRHRRSANDRVVQRSPVSMAS